MTIVCGTDFSEAAAAAAEIAALLATRMATPLRLVHALDTRRAVFNVALVLEAVERASREHLDAETARLRALGADVTPVTVDGWPDESLLSTAAEHAAAMIVLSAIGERARPRFALGSTAERVAQHATQPVLVVRNGGPIADWLRGRRPLRVLCAVDFSAASRAALEWCARLRALGACSVSAAFVDDPADEAARRGLPVAGADAAEVRGAIEAELRERFDALRGPEAVPLIVSPHLGDPAARLAHLAEREQADLVVVGTRQRHRLERMRGGSVSMALLRDAPVSVLVVPGATQAVTSAAAPRRLLAATDLSPHGDAAAAYALAIAPPGSHVRLLTVVQPPPLPTAPFGLAIADPLNEPALQALRARAGDALRALAAKGGAAGGVTIDVEVIDDPDTAAAICDAGERFAADLLCLGTRGRTGLAATLLGSVAQAVLGRWHLPLLLVPARQD